MVVKPVSSIFSIRGVHLLEHLLTSAPEFFSAINLPSGITFGFIRNTEKLSKGWVGQRVKFHVDSNVWNIDDDSVYQIFKIKLQPNNLFLDVYVTKDQLCLCVFLPSLWAWRGYVEADVVQCKLVVSSH